jgi:tRNA A-37 threonylcarbamoyl transferase component Bud32
LGPVSLSDKATIEDFVRRNFPSGHLLGIELRRLGGVLNTVYLLESRRENEKQKIVVKVFKDWYGWKWFPLALWTLGTRGFAVLGKSRLEREYAINQFLSSRGVHVPKILYVSPKERLIFKEFVYGANLTGIIKQASSPEKRSDLARVVRQVGREVAKVHMLDVALGDCKPENIILGFDGNMYFVDLEQAERGGDQAWDVAEFLYYSGHYVSLSFSEVAQILAKGFIEGYLEAGGRIENIKKARSPRYVKVFGLFTPPQHILAISNVCGEVLKSKGVGNR